MPQYHLKIILVSRKLKSFTHQKLTRQWCSLLFLVYQKKKQQQHSNLTAFLSYSETLRLVILPTCTGLGHVIVNWSAFLSVSRVFNAKVERLKTSEKSHWLWAIWMSALMACFFYWNVYERFFSSQL